MATATELSINTNANAITMAQEIFGDGVTVVDASYSGDNQSSATYSGGDNTSPGVMPADSGVILSTGRASDFTNGNGGSNTNVRNNTSTNTDGVDRDDDFDDLAGARTFDASFLEVDFIPDPGVTYVSMQFVFSSEEYPEFTNSVYNDVVGVWINGQEVEMTIGSSSVGNVNNSDNSNLYVDNTGDQYNTEMDGFTLTMSVKIPVIAGQVNTIKVGVADVSDNAYDSNLLIAGDSIQSDVLAFDDDYNVYPNGTKTVDVLANDTVANGGTLEITHINGIPVSAGDTVTLNTGQSITLNADGTLTLVGDGDTEEVSFTYKVEDTVSGESDTAMVSLSSIPCFVAGTMIATPDGQVPVESLLPGDMVLTVDNGPQPMRWIGRRRVDAVDRFAPIRISADTFGEHDTLLVSPQHRVLIRDALAELLFGEGEVLVAAKDLVNDKSVRRIEGGTVEYVHILFDTHQVVFSQGLATESFLPGPQTSKIFEQDIVDEIYSLFPEIDPATGGGYSAAARRTLKAHEARVLMSRSAVA
ncbi:Hint domain-containing protein [uncultured Aliiroseovarius sp.]|uniref:Hint domain-containing protein n=1 Tax=uncultured Aliiroseovarius sp. TaxID=1658783 RepID=UPI0034132688